MLNTQIAKVSSALPTPRWKAAVTSVCIVLACILASQLVVCEFSILRFAQARSAFLIPTLLLLTFIGLRIAKDGVMGALFDPAVATSCGFILFYSASVLLNPEIHHRTYSSSDQVGRLAVLYGGAVLMFLLGHAMVAAIGPSIRCDRSSRSEFDPRKLWWWLIFVTLALLVVVWGVCSARGIGFLAFVMQSAYTGEAVASFENAAGIERHLHQLTRILPISVSILSAVFIATPGTSRASRAAAWTILAAASFFLFAIGARFRFVYGCGGALLVWYALSRQCAPDNLRRIRRHLLLGFLAIGAIGFQMTFMRHIGFLAYSQGSQGAQVSVGGFVERGLDQVPRLQMVMNAVPQRRPHTYGVTFVSPLFTFVPRSLWPGKPSDACVYLEGYTPLRWSNVSFGLLGELYLNFGLPGIFLGAWGLGALAWAWQRFYLSRRQNLILTCVYASSIPVWFFVVRGGFHSMVAVMLYAVVVVVVVLRRSSPI